VRETVVENESGVKRPGKGRKGRFGYRGDWWALEREGKERASSAFSEQERREG